MISHGKITPDEPNHWVWFPKTNNNKILAIIYNFLNSNHADDQHWNGWMNIWKLRVAPKIRTFIWLLIQGKIKTYEYLYRMKLGPSDCCVFYGLVLETTDHLFRLCRKSQIMWNLVKDQTGLTINLNDHISNGVKLDFNHQRTLLNQPRWLL